ncbi:TPA: hypothetical protein L5668_002406 [Pseudomonas aeruginosa]|nr:hypothetical protein [Pseudomonas aeruginosa]
MKGTARPPTPRPLHTVGFWGKRSAQALKGRRRQGSSRMAAIRHEARGAAREPDGGTPVRRYAGTPVRRDAMQFCLLMTCTMIQ